MSKLTRSVAICAALWLFAAGTGCRRSDCAMPTDLSGTWSGEARDNRGARATVRLALTQSGAVIGGTYTAEGTTRGLYGLRLARRVEFDTEPAACANRLRGVGRFCGESMDLTLDGDDCDGAYHATATLRRTNTMAHVAGARAGVGGTLQGAAGTVSARAGTGGSARPPQPTLPCAYRENGRCDEPEGSGLCPEGTDEVDCKLTVRPCAYQNDGSCDEPEGTGLCDEGQDAADCKPAEICGSQLCRVPDAIDQGLGDAVRACCVGNSRCGYALGMGSCFAVTPGVIDAACGRALSSLVLAPSAPVDVPGCCRSDGLCGFVAQGIDLGCILPESLNVVSPGTYRIACGDSNDLDAGAAENAQSSEGS